MGGFGSSSAALSAKQKAKNAPPVLNTVALEAAALNAANAVRFTPRDGRASTIRTGSKGLGSVPSAPRTLLGL